MRILFLCAILSSYYLAFGLANSPALKREVKSQNAVGAVELSVSTVQLIGLGDEFNIKIHLQNGESFPLFYDDRGDPFEISVKESNGKKVKMTTLGMNELKLGTPYNGTPTIQLVPNVSIQRSYDLTRYFEIKSAGRYWVTVSRRLEAANYLEWGELSVTNQVIIGERMPAYSGPAED